MTRPPTSSPRKRRSSPPRASSSRRVTASQTQGAPVQPDRGAAGSILRTDGLTMRFGGLTAVGNVSITVARGEIRAIIGPNGAGKSTFFNCVTGVLRPTSGRVFLNGEDVAGVPPPPISPKGPAGPPPNTQNPPRPTGAGKAPN